MSVKAIAGMALLVIVAGALIFLKIRNARRK